MAVAVAVVVAETATKTERNRKPQGRHLVALFFCADQDHDLAVSDLLTATFTTVIVPASLSYALCAKAKQFLLLRRREVISNSQRILCHSSLQRVVTFDFRRRFLIVVKQCGQRGAERV